MARSAPRPTPTNALSGRIDPRGRHDGVAPSVVEVIGSTPAVELGRVSRGLRGRIVAKLEGEHAGGTVAVSSRTPG